MNLEQEIRDDIDSLRERTSSTQELYREVCALLFFRYGITPTANKLYQYVRKGSMSAPAEALARFWKELREKSRVRIEQPDLPEPLAAAAGELVMRLWTKAQADAQESLAVFRREVSDAAAAADAARLKAETDRQAVIHEVERLQGLLDAASDQTTALERRLATLQTENEALRRELSTARQERQVLEAELSGARKDFSAELEKLRDALHRAEDRYAASEKRALLEIDRERTATAKAQKELAQLRQSNAALIERQRVESSVLQRELGDTRHKLGAVEGAAARTRELLEQQASELEAARQELTQRATDNALLERDLQLREERISAFEGLLQEARRAVVPSVAAAPTARRRKSAPKCLTSDTTNAAPLPGRVRE